MAWHFIINQVATLWFTRQWTKLHRQFLHVSRFIKKKWLYLCNHCLISIFFAGFKKISWWLDEAMWYWISIFIMQRNPFFSVSVISRYFCHRLRLKIWPVSDTKICRHFFVRFVAPTFSKCFHVFDLISLIITFYHEIEFIWYFKLGDIKYKNQYNGE